MRVRGLGVRGGQGDEGVAFVSFAAGAAAVRRVHDTVSVLRRSLVRRSACSGMHAESSVCWAEPMQRGAKGQMLLLFIEYHGHP